MPATTEPRSRRWGYLAALDYESWPATEVARTLRDQGYSAVEWTLAHFDPRRMSQLELGNTIKAARDNGLQVPEIAVQHDFVTTNPSELKNRVDHTIEVARAAVRHDVNVVNVLTGPCRWIPGHVDVGRVLSEGEAWDAVLDGYERLLDGLAEIGAKAALEACWGGLAHDFHSLGIVLKRFAGHPAFAINLDPSHFVLHRNDIAWVVHQLAPYVVHVHIKDVIGVPGIDGDDFMFPMIGEGRVPWKAFFKSLADIGYDGYCSVEFESYNYYRTILKSSPAVASGLSMTQLIGLESTMPESLFA